MLCEVSHYYFSCGTPRGACEQSGLSEFRDYRVQEDVELGSCRGALEWSKPQVTLTGDSSPSRARVTARTWCSSRSASRTSHLRMDMHDGCSMHVLDHANMNWASVDTCADNDATRSCVAQGRAGLACASSGSRRYVFAAAFRAASRGI